MGQPAIVMGDRITGQCAIHQVPNPASGVPQPSPAPLPFSAPLQSGLQATVLIGGKAAAVVGSSGVNVPPHLGLHVTDPYAVPSLQQGMVTGGSATVFIGGLMAATASSNAICCAGLPGSLIPTVANVMIG